MAKNFKEVKRMKFHTTLLMVLCLTVSVMANPVNSFDRFRLGMETAEIKKTVESLGNRFSVSTQKIQPLRSVKTVLELKKYSKGVYRYVLYTNSENRLYRIEVHMNSTSGAINRLQNDIMEHLKNIDKEQIDTRLQVIDNSGSCTDINSRKGTLPLECSYDSNGIQKCSAIKGTCSRIIINGRDSVFMKKYTGAMVFLELTDLKIKPDVKEININFRQFD